MADNDKRTYSGNRFSLRSKARNQIQRIDALSSSLGAVGEALVSTWAGILSGIVALSLGVFLALFALSANKGATFLQNLPYAIIILVCTLPIAINIVMTNPSMGSQFMVSAKFLYRKISNYSSNGKTKFLKMFRFAENNNDMDDIIENNANGRSKRMSMAVYRVRGAVSPVSFEDELQRLERLDRQLLTNLDRDTIRVTINSVQKADVSPIPLPKNATPSMIRRRDNMYNQIQTLRNNQQLRTTVIIARYSPGTLRVRLPLVERVFDNGLVVSYKRLNGEEAKKEVKRIYE